MNSTLNRLTLTCSLLALLAVAGATAADSNSNGGNDGPPQQQGGGGPGGHGHRPPPSADMFFQRFDLNKDGVVTWDEFVKGHATPPPPPPDGQGKDNRPPPPKLTDEQLKERFDSLDANGDGKITREEYEAALKRGPPPPPQGQGQGKGQGHKGGAGQ